MATRRYGRFDSVSLGGIAVFGALSVLLTVLSQALGLYFPLIPYLQFDLGEVAIFLSFYIFGPVPALISSLIEFLTLSVIGQNAASFGPELKLVAIVSSLAGVWLGTYIVRKMARPTLGRATAAAMGLGIVFRSAIMTVPNYLLIVFLFSVVGIFHYVSSSLATIGVTLTEANTLGLVLGFTAVFNALQLLLVLVISYLIIRLPQMQSTRAAGRRLWITTYLEKRGPPTLVPTASREEAPR